MVKKGKYSIPEPKSQALLDIIQVNISDTNERYIKANREDVLKSFEILDKQNWYNEMRSSKLDSCSVLRLKFFRHYAAFRQKNHIEMTDTSNYREVLTLKRIKVLLSKHEHLNYTYSEKSSDTLLTMQGFCLVTFMNLWLKADMKFCDTVDSKHIEYNDPFARQRIRHFNKVVHPLGKFYHQNFGIEDFMIELMGRFLPIINGIWADYHHFTHVTVLELMRICLQIGFISARNINKIASLLSSACQSLKMLEDCWNISYEKAREEFNEDHKQTNNDDKDHEDLCGSQKNHLEMLAKKMIISDQRTGGTVGNKFMTTKILKTLANYMIKLDVDNKWENSHQKKSKMRKLEEVGTNLCKSKEHISCIVIHLLTLMYDVRFCFVYPKFIKHNFSITSLYENKDENLKLEVEEHFPFNLATFTNSIHEIVLNYLSENIVLGGNIIVTRKSTICIENVFLSLTTYERDPFILSLRMSTSSDFKYFDHWSTLKASLDQDTNFNFANAIGLKKNEHQYYEHEKSNEFSNYLRDLIKDVANGYFSPNGEIIKDFADSASIRNDKTNSLDNQKLINLLSFDEDDHNIDQPNIESVNERKKSLDSMNNVYTDN